MMQPARRQRYLLFQAVVLAFHFWSECSARSWGDVIDHSIYMPSLVDPYRAAIEDDPFDFESTLEASPTFYPTSPPIAMPSIGSVLTLAPTAVKTLAMECDARSYLHVIRMYDSWGDGWGETKMTIKTIEDTTTMAESEDVGWLHTLLRTEATTLIKPLESVFEGSLDSGNEGLSYLCLEVGKCYDINVKGSQWQDEVKWDIRAAPEPNSTESNLTGTLAKGQAPVDCQFSIPNRTTGEFTCLFSCESLTRPPSPAPSRRPSAQPSLRPTENLSLVGTVAPTTPAANTRSFNTSNNSSSAPSDLPSLTPSSVPLSPSSNDPPITAPSSGQVKLAPAVAAVSRAPSKSPSDSTFVPTSGSSFMMTMFGSSMWPTATAFPTFSFDTSLPMSGPSVVRTSTTKPRSPTASAPTREMKPQNTTARSPTSETNPQTPTARSPTSKTKPQVPSARSPTSEAKPQNPSARSPTGETKPTSASKPQISTIRGPTSADSIPIFSLTAILSPTDDRSIPTVRRPTISVPAPTQVSMKLPAPTSVPTVESTGGAVVFDAAQLDSSLTPTTSWFPTSSWSPTTVGTATAFPTTVSGLSLTPSGRDTEGRVPVPTTSRSNVAPALIQTVDVASSRKPSVSTPVADTPRPTRVSNGDIYTSAGNTPTPPILSLLLTRGGGDTSSRESFETGSITRDHSSESFAKHHAESLMYLEVADAHATSGEIPSSGPTTESSEETPLPTTVESTGSYDDDDDDRIPTPFFENVG